ncbi:MAG: hypothetical protein NTX03_14255 [Bacteroidetes bacterium]|nr:hypothetical protein [Bacteroidota bacterium]
MNNLNLFNKAKAEFIKAFNAYAKLMYKYHGIVHEQPELYYSQELAEKGEEQTQTAHYKEEVERLKKENNN